MDSVINFEPKKPIEIDENYFEEDDTLNVIGSIKMKNVSSSWIDEDAAKNFNPGE